MLVMPFAARAAGTTAGAFVEAIYAAYKGEKSKGVPLDSRANVRRHFTPSLAKLLIEDSEAAGRRGEVGKLEVDPFIEAQDWKIDSVAMRTEEIGRGKARATVSFDNLGRATTVRLDLVNGRQGWRIDEIRWDRGGTLRQALSRTP